MKVKKIPISLIGFLVISSAVFLFLSYYEFNQGRAQFLQSGPSVEPTITIVSDQVSSSPGQPIEVTWRLDTPTPRHVDSTTIYYDTQATPSALTTSDFPHAPGYNYSLTDYQSGQISSPGIFTAVIYPPESAKKLYYRGYALVDGNNYWTPEYTIEIR